MSSLLPRRHVPMTSARLVAMTGPFRAGIRHADQASRRTSAAGRDINAEHGAKVVNSSSGTRSTRRAPMGNVGSSAVSALCVPDGFGMGGGGEGNTKEIPQVMESRCW
jgi:hypothetical protein